MTLVERLLAIEEIKALKARYFRYLDTKNWAEYGEVFAASGTLEVQSIRGDAISRKETGAAAIVAWVSSVLDGATTIHHGHMPEIETLSSDRASGIWAMEDVVIWPDRRLHGWGHYHETYVRETGKWKIASSRLTRLRVDTRPGDGPLDLSRPPMLD